MVSKVDMKKIVGDEAKHNHLDSTQTSMHINSFDITEVNYSNQNHIWCLLTLNQISILIFFNLYMKVWLYKNKFKLSIETYVKPRGLVLASPPLYIIYLHCRKIHNLFVRVLEKCEKENFPVSWKKWRKVAY